MKRIIIQIIAIVLAFSMVGCSFTKASEQEKTETKENSSEKSSSILSVLSDQDATYEDVFPEETITTVNIDITQEDWNDILENAKDEEYHKVNVTVNGTTVDNVGFRTKGNSTLSMVASSDSNRYGFKLKFDKYVDDQTLQGLDMMVLNGSYADPSYMREYLTYAAAQSLGAITPYVSYTKLYINDEYYGLYLSIENYKDSFVERHTSDTNAVLYKADQENCTLTESDDTSGFEIEYGEDQDNSHLKNLIEILNQTSSDDISKLEDVLDVDSVLKGMAVNFVTGNYDSYNGSKAHNYYLLYADGKIQYIGWDYNMSFGGFMEDGGASVALDVEEPFLGVDKEQRPLMSKLLENEEYKEKYLAYVDELTTFFGDYEEKITTIADFIGDDVKADPTAFYTFEEFQTNITESDTDLSQVTVKGAKSSDQTTPGGQTPEDIGERPDMPDGQTPEDIGERPDMPDGQTPEDIGERPDMPDGQAPEDMRAGNQKAGGMTQNQTVSIYDYIKQKLEKLNA